MATGPITQSGGMETTTVTGCSPSLFYRYRVVDTDLATQATRVGPLVSGGLG